MRHRSFTMGAPSRRLSCKMHVKDRQQFVLAMPRFRRAEANTPLPWRPCPLYSTIFHATVKIRISSERMRSRRSPRSTQRWVSESSNAAQVCDAGCGSYNYFRKSLSQQPRPKSHITYYSSTYHAVIARHQDVSLYTECNIVQEELNR